ncbi:tRNA (adenosine(37)-N6)-dimethylallyltransferase MiaA [Paralimibaculum aggregatum]|uniref:tRNA dimethylallyltransferase n=1 Tax=Paralimibaculum aggregatum TaxID=3036245 RepID=A0ABQ6LFU2_9RHOB|nr:tRNA (adenosine(37)-N6)-dimethylallyltransferase MiaA [Limibaculum sp. NKW23]
MLVAGPTASGKSALALALAERCGGVVVNADSQQIYDAWRVLSARPTPAEEARAPHRLYGHVGLETSFSVGAWLRDLAPVLAAARAAGQRPVIVGGTGLYFKALTEGIAPIPEVPPEVRAAAEARLERLGLAGFAAELAARDPETAATLDRENPMRVLRASEVLDHTGTGLAEWRRRTAPPLLPLAACTAAALAPPRDWLYARCEARFEAMLAAGALEEVRRVQALGLPAAAPGLKAVGAPELMAHLSGALTLEEAAGAAKTATRRYAKRQLTWVRNQMAAWRRIEASLTGARIEALAAELAG